MNLEALNEPKVSSCTLWRRLRAGRRYANGVLKLTISNDAPEQNRRKMILFSVCRPTRHVKTITKSNLLTRRD